MKHLNEEELIEHYYSKGTAGAGKHLKTCTECAEAYAALRIDMDEMKFAVPPARDPAYGERVWQSIGPFLPAYHVRNQSWLDIGLWRGLSYAAFALLLVGAFFAGRLSEHKQAGTMAKSTPAPAQERAAPPQQRIVVVVLSDHLDRSERLLVELKHADVGISAPLRDEARSLLAANRVCRQKAKHDDPALTTALDHLDRLLAELANQPGDLNSASITRLQDEMNADRLLFEVRVLRSRQAVPGTQRKDGTI